jgi:hypothetical protein
MPAWQHGRVLLCFTGRVLQCVGALLQCVRQPDTQSINQLHVFLAREEPKKGATPTPPQVIPNR